jgi:hypothetical protein
MDGIMDLHIYQDCRAKWSERFSSSAVEAAFVGAMSGCHLHNPGCHRRGNDMIRLSLKFENLSQLSPQESERIDHQDRQIDQEKDQIKFHCSSKRQNPDPGLWFSI